MKTLCLICISLLSALPVSADTKPTAEELEAWFNDDSELKAEEVNEGALHFLARSADNIMHSENTLIISPQSIDEGWVLLKQCYHHLDTISQAQVVYQYKSMRNLKILDTQGIGKAWVEQQSIQLINVQANASLCTEAEIRVFYQNEDHSFSLVNGPFQRRFLDGYYPLRVSLKIHYPKQLLSFARVSPKQTKEFSITDTPYGLYVDTIFEGKLNTEIWFKAIPKN